MPQLCAVHGGGFQDASGAPLSKGSITARLVQDVKANLSQLVAGRLVTIPLDATGNVPQSPSPSLWGPETYQVIAYTSQGLPAWSGQIAVPDAASFSLTP